MEKKKIIFIAEKTGTGWSAYAKDYSAFTTAGTLEQLDENCLDAINTLFQDKGEPEVTLDQIEIKH